MKTHSIYQNNNPLKNKPKSSSGKKWNELVSHIWKETKTTSKTGSGLTKEYHENPIEYKYVNSFNQLMQRLFFLHAEENAGNNNFHNENIGLINFFRDLWKNILDKSKDIEYIINFVKRSPQRLIKTGPGNYIDNLNKFMQHLHFIFEEQKAGNNSFHNEKKIS